MCVSYRLSRGPFDQHGATLATADRQIARFKEAKATGQTDKRVCDVGLWAYSRHPNYFFEVVIWSAFAVFALDLSGAWNWISEFRGTMNRPPIAPTRTNIAPIL